MARFVPDNIPSHEIISARENHPNGQEYNNASKQQLFFVRQFPCFHSREFRWFNHMLEWLQWMSQLEKKSSNPPWTEIQRRGCDHHVRKNTNVEHKFVGDVEAHGCKQSEIKSIFPPE